MGSAGGEPNFLLIVWLDVGKSLFAAFLFAQLLSSLDFLSGFDFGIPAHFPHGELLRGERLAGHLAPDPQIPAVLFADACHIVSRDALFAAIGFLLLASPFGALLVGELKPGTATLDAVNGSLDSVMTLGAGDFV